MVVYAQVGDVEKWLPLTGRELLAAQALLDRVSALMRLNVVNLDARIAAEPDLAVVASGVAVDGVLRVLRNPDGKVQEAIDDYSFRRADAVADGVLYLTGAELAQLAPAAARSAVGAFTIRPGAR